MTALYKIVVSEIPMKLHWQELKDIAKETTPYVRDVRTYPDFGMGQLVVWPKRLALNTYFNILKKGLCGAPVTIALYELSDQQSLIKGPTRSLSVWLRSYPPNQQLPSRLSPGSKEKFTSASPEYHSRFGSPVDSGYTPVISENETHPCVPVDTGFAPTVPAYGLGPWFPGVGGGFPPIPECYSHPWYPGGVVIPPSIPENITYPWCPGGTAYPTAMTECYPPSWFPWGPGLAPTDLQPANIINPPAPTARLGLPLVDHVNSRTSPELSTRSPSEQETGDDTCELPVLHLRSEKPSPADAFGPVIVDGSRGMSPPNEFRASAQYSADEEENGDDTCEESSSAGAPGPVIVDGSRGTLALNR